MVSEEKVRKKVKRKLKIDNKRLLNSKKKSVVSHPYPPVYAVLPVPRNLSGAEQTTPSDSFYAQSD